MESIQSIIPKKGRRWAHQTLERLAKSKEFPSRLRIFYLLKRAFGLDLLSYTTPSGLQLVLNLEDWVQSQIYFYGNYEVDSVNLFKSLSINANVIFDIGAHVGQYALECAQIDLEKTKQIFALEVNPKTFTYLLNNIQINGFKNVTPVLGAVTANNEIVNINIPAYWNLGNSQIAQSNNTLDNYLVSSFSIIKLLKMHNLNFIDLVKIDVEGQEIFILKDLFSAGCYPINILFEFIPDAFEHANEVIELLIDNNYTLKDIFGNPFSNSIKLTDQNIWARRS